MPPRFEPFRGLRYDDSLAPLAVAICPPYDVVDDAERAELASRSPYNAIHVELPIEDPAVPGDRYANAAALFAEWQRDGALRRDDAPCLYVYRMTFKDEAGGARSSTGVIGALGVDAAGEGSVLPHERTMPKPKGDRLDLLRATAINTSPIWGLSLADGLTDACTAATGSGPAHMSATDDDGVTHELWAVTDDAAIATISGLIESTPIVVADGHHRYETSLFYRQERHDANGEAAGAEDLVMALVVELTEDELFVQAIHRLVSGVPEGHDLLADFARFFEISDGAEDITELGRQMSRDGGLGLVYAGRHHLLVPKPIVESEAEAALDSSRLDVALAALGPHNLEYQHGAQICAAAVASGRAQAAVLLRPATVAQIADTAHSGRRMPPKTTFFQPKPRTGMVFRPVAD
ncbi:MAG TPA: DUF1015 domain-containing protein [Acidimicrobiales bacterium]|nr:DUF1015 domain-containing protein [Acidimicrobiales bacterium]